MSELMSIVFFLLHAERRTRGRATRIGSRGRMNEDLRVDGITAGP